MLKSLGTCIDWAAGGYAPRTNDELRHALLAPWTEVEGQKPSDDRVAGEDPRPAARTFTALCSKKATILNKVPVRRCQSTQWHTSADPMPGKRMTASHRPEPIRVAAVKWPERGVCHERAVCVQRCGTVREMKEGPSRPAVRCRSQATASCCRQERWW